jgi:hypothetical protein
VAKYRLVVRSGSAPTYQENLNAIEGGIRTSTGEPVGEDD